MMFWIFIARYQVQYRTSPMVLLNLLYVVIAVIQYGTEPVLNRTLFDNSLQLLTMLCQNPTYRTNRNTHSTVPYNICSLSVNWIE